MTTKVKYRLQKPMPVFVGGAMHGQIVPNHLWEHLGINVALESRTATTELHYVRAHWYDVRCGLFVFFALDGMHLDASVQLMRALMVGYK